ncbi:hypothetical protein FNH22_13315 [Fulvivirga sp. M361]|uniref:DUF6493 family protein n=1 Tax=Fulvivirga sp. M361 TaxID=2594266 RepID=UPI00117B15FF|nr:DUF6493 family protein [Fulvivirga sp. M361]TRX58848.1 hypothetical protein FNH22_13315 [Fulvivirga sp. M361]
MSKKTKTAMEDIHLYENMTTMTDQEWFEYVTGIGSDQKKKAALQLKPISKELFNWETRDQTKIALRPKCFIGCLALWSYSDIKKLDWTAYWSIKEPAVFRAIKKLRLNWIPQYFDHILDQNFRAYDHVRKYYTEGVIPKPTSDNYIVGLISIPERLRFNDRDNTNNLYHFLVENNDVLSEDFWRIFQVQGTGDANMSSIEKYGGPPYWDKTIEKLITNGKLNRQEILEKTFDPLKNEWIQFRSGWFSRFHEFLNPTLSERKSLEDQYLSLLSNAIGPTKSFALKALHLLSKNNLLDPQKYLDQVDHVLISDKKGVVNMAISILEKIVKNDASFSPLVIQKIIRGLLLSDVDVQKKICNLLGKMPGYDSIICDELKQYKECVLPSLKIDFAKWIETDHSISPDPGEEDIQSVEAFRETIEPILDAQELSYHITRTLESPSNIADIEQIYQSAFLIKEFPVELLKPIEKRIIHWYNLSDGFSFTRGYLAGFLLSWINDFNYDIEYEAKYESFKMSRIFLFQKARLNQYLQIKRNGKDYNPLSIPDIKPYFIDANTFVDRVADNQKANQAIDEHDLIQAIVRLDMNSEFDKQKLSIVSGEIRNIVEFMFLQGNYKPDKFPFAWLAAARTLSPNEILKIHSEYDSYYDVVEPALLKWNIHIDKGPYHHDKIIIDPPLQLKDTTAKKGLFSSLNVLKKREDNKIENSNHKLIYPLQLLSHFDGWFMEYDREMDIKWMLSSTPNKQDVCYSIAARWIGSCAGYSSVSDIPSKYFLEDLCLSNQSLDEMKCLTICAGLGCSEKSVKAMATEAVISAIHQSRINLELMGKILDKMICSHYMRLNRLVAELKTISGVSKQHSEAVEEIILHSIQSTSPQAVPKYFKKLLELLLEVSITNGTSGFDESRQELFRRYSDVSNLKRVIKLLCSL